MSDLSHRRRRSCRRSSLPVIEAAVFPFVFLIFLMLAVHFHKNDAAWRLSSFFFFVSELKKLCRFETAFLFLFLNSVYIAFGKIWMYFGARFPSSSSPGFGVDQIKECGSVSSDSNNTLLAALFHVLALLLNQNAEAQEDASKSGLIKIASDILYQWNTSLDGREK
ncbi:E3 ubiquitin-protein ligase UPL1-like [Senna tora]|uniref:E3 ubiquitin-protein ligase UPL1-like n=1 Tax=Senna tora TaxID=362788 RepID=A0A834W353_9FABA|nr:E3 ubiquitin-protein ligase UPL1-like [Senna tora]